MKNGGGREMIKGRNSWKEEDNRRKKVDRKSRMWRRENRRKTGRCEDEERRLSWGESEA